MTPGLDPGWVAAVAAVWQRERREITTCFRGDSMQPSIAPEDLVRLRFGEECSVGDTVLAVTDARIVLHRLVARAGGWFLSAGDANLIPDVPIRREQIVARVVEGDARAPIRSRRPFVRAVLQRLCIGALFIHPSLADGTVSVLRRLVRRDREPSISGPPAV